MRTSFREYERPLILDGVRHEILLEREKILHKKAWAQKSITFFTSLGLLVTLCKNSALRIWRIQTNSLLKIIRLKEEPRTISRADENSLMCISGPENQDETFIRIFSVNPPYELKEELKVDLFMYWACPVSSYHFITVDRFNDIYLGAREGFKILKKMKRKFNFRTKMRFSIMFEDAFYLSRERAGKSNIRLIKYLDDTVHQEIKDINSSIISMEVYFHQSKRVEYVVFGGHDQAVHFYDTTNGCSLLSVFVKHKIRSLCVIQNYLLVGQWYGYLEMFHIGEAKTDGIDHFFYQDVFGKRIHPSSDPTTLTCGVECISTVSTTSRFVRILTLTNDSVVGVFRISGINVMRELGEQENKERVEFVADSENVENAITTEKDHPFICTSISFVNGRSISCIYKSLLYVNETQPKQE